MTTSDDAAPGRWIGARVPQREDRLLVQGRGTYVDDIHLPGMLHLAVLRSSHAHARIRRVEAATAGARTGVHLILTGADVESMTDPFRLPSTSTGLNAGPRPLAWHALATDRVRYAGEPLAAVVAADRYVAEDALDEISVDYEVLPAVTTPTDALAPGAARLYPDWPDNVMIDYRFAVGDVDRAIAAADVVVEEELGSHRYTAMPIETRGCIAAFDGNRLTVWSTTQWPHLLRGVLASCLRLPEHRIRVITPNVGGGFGVKANVYPEDVLVPLAAMRLRRPVKWIEDRREHFYASAHAREQTHRVTLAFAADGTLLAVRTRAQVNMGAGTIFPAGSGPMFAGAACMPAGYKFDNYEYHGTGVVTNKTPYGAYRGFGMTVTCQVLERAMDMAARRLGMDPVDLRRKNWLSAAELPYRTATGSWLTTGSFRNAIDAAVSASDYWGFRARQAEARAQGRLPGIGIAMYVEGTGASQQAVSGYWGNWEHARLVPTPDGKVLVYSGLASQGQSHETMLAQVVADELGLHLDDVAIILGDTDAVAYGMGAFSSRGAMIGGAAAVRASEDLKQKFCRLAAGVWAVAETDVEYADGGVRACGAPQRRLTFSELAHLSLTDARRLPPGQAPLLEGQGIFDMAAIERPPDALGRVPRYAQWSDGCCVATCEVDPETGEVTLTGLWLVHDCGRVINPVALDGQMVGGLAQAVGGVLLEELVHDREGQLLTGSFMDYLLPTATDVPPIQLIHMESPAPEIPGGFKGAGEGATIVGPPAIMGAVADALAPLGVEIRSSPLSPSVIRELIRRAGGVNR